MVWERFPNGTRTQTTTLDYADWADQNQSFDAMAAFLMNSVSMIGPDGIAEQVTSQSVSPRFFDVLGVTPIAGRIFQLSDAVAPNSVVLSEGFWRRRFGADPGVVGRSIVIEGRPQTVIGIVPNRFQAGTRRPSATQALSPPVSGRSSTSTWAATRRFDARTSFTWSASSRRA